MQCKALKITLLEIENEKDFSKLLRPDKIYSFGSKYRLVYKRKTNYKSIPNTYIEYFKTLEYGTLIQEP